MQPPELAARLPEQPEHRDRCFLEPPAKRRLRLVDGAIGLATGETVIS
jgi:hypothetical protein